VQESLKAAPMINRLQHSAEKVLSRTRTRHPAGLAVHCAGAGLPLSRDEGVTERGGTPPFGTDAARRAAQGREKAHGVPRARALGRITSDCTRGVTVRAAS
jgi:hypothetical protein